MIRRNFLKVSSAVLAVGILAPSSLSARDFRKSHKKTWLIPNDMKLNLSLVGTNAAIKDIFGTDKTIDGNGLSSITLKAPSMADRGEVVAVSVITKLKAKTIAILQSSNPESLITVFDIHKRSIPNYSIRMRLLKEAIITAVIETTDGKLYRVSKQVDVVDGCGG